MKWLILAVIMILCFFILVLLTKVTIFINYYHRKDDDDLSIELRAWFGLVRYKKHFPLIKVDDQSASIIVKEKSKKTAAEETENKISVEDVLNNLKNYQEILEHVVQFNRIVRRFLNTIAVKRFDWQSIIGVGDAARTGTAAGVLWTIKGSITGLISHYLRMKTMPQIMVYPHFQQMITQTNLSCMIQFRIGYAIGAGLLIVKFWKGGKSHLKSTSMRSNEKVKTI